MFAPVQMPSFIQTVHGLSYKVVRTAKQEDNEDPQRSRQSGNRLSEKKPQQEKRSQK